jgi:hypothetical protein
MFGVIIASLPSNGVSRQTAVIPHNGTVRIFTRIGAGQRGSSGAWSETTPAGNLEFERIIATPASVAITESDAKALDNDPAPTVLLQKLARKVNLLTGLNPDPAQTLQAVLADLTKVAVEDPASLVVYSGKQVSAPNLAPAPTPTAPVRPTATAVAPTNSDSELVFSLRVPQLTDSDVASYIPRSDIYGVSEDALYDFCRKSAKNLGLEGHAGTGKTSSARYQSARWGVPFLTLECGIMLTDADTQGKYVPDGVGGLRWVNAPLVEAIQQPSIVLLNEVTRMPPKSAQLFLRLLQERELQLSNHLGEVIPVHPECVFVADFNSGYRGTTPLDQAFADRLGTKVVFSWSSEAEAQRIPSQSLLEFARSLRYGAEVEGKYSVPVTTRILLNFVDHAKGLGFNFAVRSFINAFPAEEQDAFKMLFEVHADNIANELGVTNNANLNNANL